MGAKAKVGLSGGCWLYTKGKQMITIQFLVMIDI